MDEHDVIKKYGDKTRQGYPRRCCDLCSQYEITLEEACEFGLDEHRQLTEPMLPFRNDREVRLFLCPKHYSMWDMLVSLNSQYKQDQYFLHDTLMEQKRKGTLDDFYLEFYDKLFNK